MTPHVTPIDPADSRPSSDRSAPLVRDVRGQAKSRSESRYLAFVDLVDLNGVDKFLGVAQVDLLANKYVEQVRVDMSVQPEVPEDPERLRKLLAGLIRPVLGGQRLE